VGNFFGGRSLYKVEATDSEKMYRVGGITESMVGLEDWFFRVGGGFRCRGFRFFRDRGVRFRLRGFRDRNGFRWFRI